MEKDYSELWWMNLQTYTSNSLNVYIYKLDEIVLEFNKTVDSTT